MLYESYEDICCRRRKSLTACCCINIFVALVLACSYMKVQSNGDTVAECRHISTQLHSINFLTCAVTCPCGTICDPEACGIAHCGYPTQLCNQTCAYVHRRDQLRQQYEELYCQNAQDDEKAAEQEVEWEIVFMSVAAIILAGCWLHVLCLWIIQRPVMSIEAYTRLIAADDTDDEPDPDDSEDPEDSDHLH